MLFRNQDNVNQRTRRTIVRRPERPNQEAIISSIKHVDFVNPSFLARNASPLSAPCDICSSRSD